MSIKLKGSSDGSVSLDAPADTSPTGTDVTFVLPTADGTAEQVLKTDGSGNLSFADNVSSGRNLAINGAIKVSQRGTSKTGLTGSIGDYYTVDRWRFENYNDASTNTSVWTMEQSTDAPEGFSNSLKCTATTADSDYGSGSSQTNVETRIEAQDLQHLKYGTANAEKLTLSFWVKSSVTGTYLNWFYQEDDVRHCTRTYTVNSANTWEYKTVTINGDTTGVIDNNNGLGLIVRWLLATGTGFQGGTAPDGSWAAYNATDTYVGHAVNVASTVNNSFAITGVQLEVGSVATKFEHRSYGDELQRCKRYFQKFGTGAEFIRAATGTIYANAPLQSYYTLPVAMRATPTGSNAAGGTTVTAQGYTNAFSSSPGTHEYTAYLQNSTGTIVLGLNYNQADNGNTNLPTSVAFVRLNDTIHLSAEL